MKTLRALKCFATLKVAPAEGQVFSCPDDEAEDLIRAGYAEEVETEAVDESETETVDEAEAEADEAEKPEENKKEEPEDEGERADAAADSAAPKRGRRKSAGK